MKKTSMKLLICMVVLLAIVPACKAGEIGSLFATRTPTPTITPSPTPTTTPTPTLPPTPTALPTGTAKTSQADGSVLFTDYDHQYSLVFPETWTAISLNPEDLKQMMASVSGSNPELKKTIAMLENMDPQSFRIFAFDFRPGHMTDGYASNVNIMVQSNSIISGMTLQNLVDLNAQALPKSIPNLTVLSSKVTKTASGIPVGIIEINMPINTANGKKVMVFEQMNIIQLPQAMAVITFTTPLSLQAILMPEFNTMIDSFKITER